jgi:hypothetical protein
MTKSLEDKLEKAMEMVKSMNPEQYERMKEAQRRSWFVGEWMLEHPTCTREEAEERYKRAKMGT